MALADLLKSRMKERELSLLQVAKKAGLPKATVQSLTNGKATYVGPITKLYALSAALDLSVEEMCGAILGVGEDGRSEDENGPDGS